MKQSNITSLLILIVVVLLLGVGGVIAKSQGLFGGSLGGSVQKDTGTNISDDSAVFLTNGQVYFGKIYGRSNGVLDLRNIYYLQVNQTVQPDQKPSASAAASPSPQVSLVKLGNELHGPNDRMQINENQVLFTESLKSDSKVVQAIASYGK